MSYSSEVIADAPWSYWKVDETSGTNAADSSGNSKAGTYFTSPTLNQAALLVGSTASIDLAGTGQSVYRNHESGMNSASVTVEAWIRLDGSPGSNGRHTVVAKQDYTTAASSRAFNLHVLASDGSVTWTGELTSGSAFTATSAAGVVALNTTYHVVGTWNGTIACLYVNGVLVASHTITGTLRTSAYALQFGKDSSGNNRCLNGRMDELAYFTTALSAARVAVHYAEGMGGGPGVLAAVLPKPTVALAAYIPRETGALAAVLPKPVVALGGTYTAPVTPTGDLAAILPKPVVALAGDYHPHETGSLDAVLPKLTTDLDGTYTPPPHPVGDLAAVLPFLTVAFTGNYLGPILTDTSNAFTGLSLSWTAEVFSTQADVSAPAAPAVRVEKAIALPEPVLVKGRPT